MWYVYIIQSSKDNSLYTGITNDLDKRIAKHNANKGAKYTKGRGPFTILKSIECATKSEALKLEYVIKQKSKKDKLKPQILFCDGCFKIVPEDEVFNYEPILMLYNDFCKDNRYVHQYQKYVNLNGPSGGMNFCGGYQTQYCGNIREPSQEEYFIYITCK